MRAPHLRHQGNFSVIHSLFPRVGMVYHKL